MGGNHVQHQGLAVQARCRDRRPVDAGPAGNLRVSRPRHQGRHQGRLRRPPRSSQRQEGQGRRAALARPRLHVPDGLRPERMGHVRVCGPGREDDPQGRLHQPASRASRIASSSAPRISRCSRSWRRRTSRPGSSRRRRRRPRPRSSVRLSKVERTKEQSAGGQTAVSPREGKHMSGQFRPSRRAMLKVGLAGAATVASPAILRLAPRPRAARSRSACRWR